MNLSGPYPNSAQAHVLLLNPPAPQPVLRDNYCGFMAKASYLWPPVDLLVQSGWLARDFRVSVVDAVAEGLGNERCLGRIIARRPQVVHMLSSGATFEDDAAFLGELRRRLPETRMVASLGRMVIEPRDYLARFPWMDGVLGDYTSPDLLRALRGEAIAGDLYTREELTAGVEPREPKPRRLSYPVPQHGIFPLRAYSMPLGWQGTFSAVLTSFGCAHECSFCSGGATRYRLRPREEVLEELATLKALGVKNLFFVDYTFTTHRKALLTLCREMVRRDLTFRYTCFGRVDHLDRELLRAMKASGCDLIQIGVESGDDRILERYRKGFTVEQVRRAFALCREEQVRTLAFFILGLPGETRRTVDATVELALELDPDLASFALPTPDAGTALRSEAVEQGLVEGGPMQVISTVGPTFGTRELPVEELRKIRASAVRRFYLRPRFLWRQLRDLNSLADVREKAENALSLFARSQ